MLNELEEKWDRTLCNWTGLQKNEIRIYITYWYEFVVFDEKKCAPVILAALTAHCNIRQ